jgi:hypothetical protein
LLGRFLEFINNTKQIRWVGRLFVDRVIAAEYCWQGGGRAVLMGRKFDR